MRLFKEVLLKQFFLLISGKFNSIECNSWMLENNSLYSHLRDYKIDIGNFFIGSIVPHNTG